MTDLSIGVLASLGTASSWATSALIHSEITRLLGVRGLLMFRQPLAVFVLLVLCLMAGQFVAYPFWPLFMAIGSGLVGLALCDWCFYSGVLLIGIRPALVCQSLNVCCTGIFGVIFMGETLGLQGFSGIIISTLGVTIVILAKQRGGVDEPSCSRANRVKGVCFALASSVLLSIGIIMSKEAMLVGVPPLMLSFLRNLAALVGVWGCLMFVGHFKDNIASLKACPQSIKLFLIGCIFGPVGGIWLSMVALNNAPVAIASTLIGLQPVVLLIISGVWERRFPALGAIFGSVIACLGAAILLLR